MMNVDVVRADYGNQQPADLMSRRNGFRRHVIEGSNASMIKKRLESRMQGNLHVRVGVGAGERSPAYTTRRAA